MFRRLLVFFILITAIDFFRIIFIPGQAILLLSFASSAFLGVATIIIGIYDPRKKGFNQNFSIEVGLLLTATFLSLFGALWGHNQSLHLTLWIESYMLFWFLYFFLHIIRIRPSELETIIMVLAILYILIFVAQYVLYPRIIVNARIGVERGTIRIFIPGGSFAWLMFYYFLQSYFRKNDIKSAAFVLVYLMIPVLQGSRTAIATTLFGAFVFILFSKYVQSRILIILMAVFSGMLFFVIFEDIILSLIELSQSQSANMGEDLRVKAIKFYLFEFYPNTINYFIGNGTGHMASHYGMEIFYYKSLGLYQSDIGIIGKYTQYGVLYVLANILILRKIFVTKMSPQYQYIKFWAVTLTIGTITGGTFGSPSTIVVIASVLYFIDVSNYEWKERILETL